MKTKLCTFLIAGVFTLTGCNDKKEAYDSTPANSKDSIEAAHGDTHAHEGDVHDHSDATVDTEAPVEVTVKGRVIQKSMGKDGYTALIKDDSGKDFYVTISRANLDDPQQYKEVNDGDIITVKGESFKMNDRLHIKVEEIK